MGGSIKVLTGTGAARRDGGPRSGELSLEAVETLAFEGQALIRRRVETALVDGREKLARELPGPEGIGPWLEDFVASVRRAVVDDLGFSLTNHCHLPGLRRGSGLPAVFDAVSHVSTGELAASAGNDPGGLLHSLYAALCETEKRSRRVDGLVEWTWGCGIGRLPVHPWLREALAGLTPHRTVTKMLATNPAHVAARCRDQWRDTLFGLLDHLCRRLTSELSVIWAKQVYACCDLHREQTARTPRPADTCA